MLWGTRGFLSMIGPTGSISLTILEIMLVLIYFFSFFFFVRHCINYVNLWGRANNVCGKLLKVILNFFALWLMPPKDLGSILHLNIVHYNFLFVASVFIESINTIHHGIVHLCVYFLITLWTPESMQYISWMYGKWLYIHEFSIT